jgi:hypothetical protein
MHTPHLWTPLTTTKGVPKTADWRDFKKFDGSGWFGDQILEFVPKTQTNIYEELV